MKHTIGFLTALLLVACAGAPNPTPTELVDAGTQVDAGHQVVEIPNTPAGRQLRWYLDWLNGAEVSRDEVSEHFSQGFLQAVPATAIIQVTEPFMAEAPWALVDFEGKISPTILTAVVTRADGQYWRIFLQTAPAAADDVINGLLLDRAGDLDPSLATFTQVDEALRNLVPNPNLLAANVEDCSAIHELNADTSLALGSTFKLWVLAALAKSIEEGEHTWDETVAIQDRYKSLPSGTMQNEPNGKLFTLRQYAERMISVSDNTATDHLLFTLGREKVEAMLTETSHHAPAQNIPFLGTREMFLLKLMLTPTQQQAYIAASADEKRALIEQYDATIDPRTYRGPPWVNPRLIAELEWFATPKDLCQLTRTLKAYADKPATKPVADILALNGGLGDLPGRFQYVGYKGGSEPGVLNMTWLLQRKSDRQWRFFTIGLNDPEVFIDEDPAVYVMGAARALLGK